MEVLKSCPFCGEKTGHLMDRLATRSRKYCVWCRKCDCTGPLAESTEKAVRAWNKRH
jgi:Lar family restriction alleviation protein